MIAQKEKDLIARTAVRSSFVCIISSEAELFVITYTCETVDGILKAEIGREFAAPIAAERGQCRPQMQRSTHLLFQMHYAFGSKTLALKRSPSTVISKMPFMM